VLWQFVLSVRAQPRDGGGGAAAADAAALAARAARDSGVHDAGPHGGGGRGTARGPGVVRPAAVLLGRVQRGRRVALARRTARAGRRALGLARLRLPLGGDARRARP